MSPTDAASAALEALLARFADMVRQVSWRYGLPPQDVDEIFQEVRIRLWQARPAGENLSTLGASYVYRTAVSAVLDVIRRRRAKRESSIDAKRVSTEVALASVESPERDAEGSELGSQIWRAVEELPKSRRPAVRMYLAGYPREEIARTLGWSEAKTRNLLYRGLADLRELLTARGIGPEARP
jgi:RNA polymerase sigma factor (sigma-70 family)